jgi:2-polyprenyl-3-methyl-5-hydroxy-6-metoxy-1,4-benzoquinol methylase
MGGQNTILGREIAPAKIQPSLLLDKACLRNPGVNCFALRPRILYNWPGYWLRLEHNSLSAVGAAPVKDMDLKAQLQEEQYRIPYHYLPVAGPGGFSQVHYWSWGYRYLGRLRIVMDWLEQLPFDSLVDIGCGDGRFLHEVSLQFSGKTLLGIDCSATAIDWARRMNPGLAFDIRDILAHPLPAVYGVATLLDVIEHVPPDQLEDFVTAALAVVRPGGYLILTVPHTNMPLDPKHYEHFNPRKLDRLLAGAVDSCQYLLFDGRRWPMTLLEKLMGGSGRHFIITSRWLTNLLYSSYQAWCLRDSHPQRCQRLACLARKPPPPSSSPEDNQ